MSIFFAYFRSHYKAFSLYFVFSLVFFIVFRLYQLPLESVLYAFLLCTIVGSGIALLDFTHFYKRHQRLQAFKHQVTLSLDGMLESRDLIENDYRECIEIVYHAKQQMSSRHDQNMSEMMEYYNLWAHQIKTPIAALQLLIDEEENLELQSELFKIEQYVEMVLSYARLDSEDTDYQIKYLDLDDVIRQAVRKYAKLFVRSKLSLNYESVNLSVLSDEKWLLFVIEQLLSNALKYTQSGGIKIYNEGNVLIIEDSGIGIRPDDTLRVFEKGFTGYNGHSDKKSTGIGLYLCKRICMKLNHQIRIESEVNQGTKVLLDLSHFDLEVE